MEMDGDGTGRNARGVRGKTRLELGDLLRGELADAMSLFLVRLGGEADDVLRRARPVQHLAAPFAPRPQDVGVRPAVSRVRVRNARRRTPRTTRTKCFSSSSARRRPPRRGSRAVESRAGVRTPRECFRPNALNGPDHLWHTAMFSRSSNTEHTFHGSNYYVTSAIVTVCICGERSAPGRIIGSANVPNPAR